MKARALEVNALNLRRLGLTYRQIASRLGCHEDTVYKSVKRALGRLIAERDELAEELRKLEDERYDSYLVALQSGIEEGDVKSILAAVRISERRCKLFGLDIPVHQKVELSNDGSKDEALVLAEILARLERHKN